MLQRIEYARRQALEAREKAQGCLDVGTRAEWEKAAELWEQIIGQYEKLLAMGEKARPIDPASADHRPLRLSG